MHTRTPSARSSENGGYTTIEGRALLGFARRSDPNPNGTWHDHGNERGDAGRVADILDFPLLEFLDCSWIDEDFPGEREGNARPEAGPRRRLFAKLYGAGGLLPGFVSHTRGIGHDNLAGVSLSRAEIRAALDAMRAERAIPMTRSRCASSSGDRSRGIPDLDYPPSCCVPAEATRWKRETANNSISRSTAPARPRSPATASIGRPTTSSSSELPVATPHQQGPGDAVLYLCSDRPLFERSAIRARAAPPRAR